MKITDLLKMFGNTCTKHMVLRFVLLTGSAYMMLQTAIAAEDNVNQTQVFVKPELPSEYNLHFIGVFEVLKQPTRCSYVNLTTCHSNEYSYELYYRQCYSDVCAKDKYFCLNYLNGNSLHICGQSEDCKKRSRNIVVLSETLSDQAGVYRVGCPPGYFQANKGNCFTQCLKDEAIVLVTATKAYCNSQNNFCNGKDVKLFELGSEEDHCVDAVRDLNHQCDLTEELLPDCTCGKKCRPGEKRDLNGQFLCSTSSKSMEDQQNLNTATTTQLFAKKPSQKTIQEISVDMNISEENLEAKQNSVSADNQSVQPVMIIAVVPIVGMLGAGVLVVAVIVGLFILKSRRNHNRGQTSSQNDTYFLVNMRNHGNGQQNMQRAPSVGDSRTSSDVVSINGEYSQPQMENLKLLCQNENQVDSGINTSEQSI